MINCIKVKCQIETPAQYVKYNLTEESLTLNELVDVVAGHAAEVFGRHQMAIRKDEEQFIEVYLIALRLATIGASIWKACGNSDQASAGGQLEKPKSTRAEGVKRKLDAAIASASGQDNHSTYEQGR